MNTTFRKLVVGFLALGALVGVYLLYAQLDRTPSVGAGHATPQRAFAADVNAAAPENVGTVLDVGVGQVEQTRLYHRNERNEVDREFGFEQLLHKEGNQWEITNPYMKLFLPEFRCEVTADRGKVQVETAFDRLTANDALFSGNVVIHIVPSEPTDTWECYIHLYDVGFLAAKSLFSSTGPVRFYSRSAQFAGTGMELVYDEVRSRLELLRIFALESLRLSSQKLGAVADLTPPRPAQPAPSQAPAAGPAAAAVQSDRYECLFRKNVVIEMPDRIVTSRDVLAIDNILWSGSKKPENATKQSARSRDPNVVPHPGPDALDTTASSHLAIRAIPPESFDVVVTCEGGLVVTPMGASGKPAGGGQVAKGPEQKTQTEEQRTEDNAPSAVSAPAASDSVDRQRVTAQRIHFNAFTRDTTLVGPVAMAFPLDPNGLADDATGAQPMPMTITAAKAVQFLAASDQVLFDGGCTVGLKRAEPNMMTEYALTAPRLVLDIVANTNEGKGMTVSARKIVTEGGPAAVRILRRGSDKLLGWTSLDAAQLQYEVDPHPPAVPGATEASGARFTAIGPGVLWVRNVELANPKADPNQFSLGRPCYARLTNFDTLTYTTSTNRIVAEDDGQQLLLDYFPLVEGKYDEGTRVVAGHVEASLKEIVKGRLEFASLTASNGIEYEDETNHVNFTGSSLFYDYGQAQVTVRGDAEQRCYLNGAQVDWIEMNLKTGQVKTEIPAPSVFQVRR